jgi:hypothetical protein
MKTPQAIKKAIVRRVQLDDNLSQKTSPIPLGSPVEVEQSSIGWIAFLQGFVSQQWNI